MGKALTAYSLSDIEKLSFLNEVGNPMKNNEYMDDKFLKIDEVLNIIPINY